MAVYKRNYKRFEGSLTDPRWRVTILARYALQTVLESRLLASFATLCLAPHLVALILIYLRNNPGAAGVLNLPFLQYISIDGTFFLRVFTIETYLSFLLVTFVGPNLIAPDLANNALPLYLSRPLSKHEYIIGKLSVLITLTSLITWIPGLFVIAIQTNQAGLSWLSANARIPVAVVIGSWIWIVTISLIALALSAWVKMRPTAIFSLFGVFFIAGSFGNLANNLLNLQPPWGLLMDMNTTMSALWQWLLLGQTEFSVAFRRMRMDSGLPSWTALVSLAGFSAVSLFLLVKKVRASEVVRG
jgi:ABC-2 type transport system permease protein